MRICRLLLPVLLLAGCSASRKEGYPLPAVPDYASAGMWCTAGGTGLPADVFYVLPTCVWDWQDAQGTVYHHMDPADTVQRALVEGSNRLAQALFGGSCRYFSPYYRQITMDSWMQPAAEIEKRYAVAHADVVRAFRHYMEHFNAGRPFVLAGHSQGAKAVIELLKHSLTPEEHRRLVAAYAFGFTIPAEDTTAYPLLRPARGATDRGTVICYNSVSRAGAESPLLAGNAVCINPVNWRTDTTYAPASAHLGAVFFNTDGTSDTLRTVGVRLDPAANLLLVDGLRDEDYYIPSIATLFPRGNYHVQELNLYFLDIQANLRERIAAFDSPRAGFAKQ